MSASGEKVSWRAAAPDVEGLIIRDAGRYYVVFTMHPFSPRDEKHLQDPDQGSAPGIRIYSSADFTSWRDDGWLVKSSELAEIRKASTMGLGPN